MPFDGNPEVFVDETTALLIKAREVLVEKGWCTGVLHNDGGQHCALGALEFAQGRCMSSIDFAQHPAIKRLAGTVPNNFEGRMQSPYKLYAHDVAGYNNAQTSIEPILAWFDRAIEMGVK